MSFSQGFVDFSLDHVPNPVKICVSVSERVGVVSAVEVPSKGEKLV